MSYASLTRMLLIPILMYDSETMLWKEKERSRISVVQMDNLRDLLGIKRMDKVPNVWVRELCKVKKGVDGRIDEGILWWFSHVHRMENDKIAKGVYVREFTDSHLVGQPWKRWIDNVKNC